MSTLHCPRGKPSRRFCIEARSARPRNPTRGPQAGGRHGSLHRSPPSDSARGGALASGKGGGRAAGGRGFGPGAGLPSNSPYTSNVRLSPGRMEPLEMILDAKYLRVWINDGPEGGSTNGQADHGVARYGPVALNVGGTGEVRFKQVEVKDLGRRVIPAEEVSSHFRMQPAAAKCRRCARTCSPLHRTPAPTTRYSSGGRPFPVSSSLAPWHSCQQCRALCLPNGSGVHRVLTKENTTKH